MDASIRPTDVSGVLPITPRKQRGGDREQAPFELDQFADEVKPEPRRSLPDTRERAERLIVPLGEDEVGARLDLSA